jgi:DNA-binding NarL/FixJ family response regulator
MPALIGLQAISQLRSGSCLAKIVFLTVLEDQDYVGAAFATGASGYVTKSHVTPDLVPAICEALFGNTYVSKSINPSG